VNALSHNGVNVNLYSTLSHGSSNALIALITTERACKLATKLGDVEIWTA